MTAWLIVESPARFPQGLKPAFSQAYAALKRRSSTVAHTFVIVHAFVVELGIRIVHTFVVGHAFAVGRHSSLGTHSWSVRIRRCVRIRRWLLEFFRSLRNRADWGYKP